jgi:hypothetical protein
LLWRLPHSLLATAARTKAAPWRNSLLAPPLLLALALGSLGGRPGGLLLLTFFLLSQQLGGSL